MAGSCTSGHNERPDCVHRCPDPIRGSAFPGDGAASAVASSRGALFPRRGCTRTVGPSHHPRTSLSGGEIVVAIAEGGPMPGQLITDLIPLERLQEVQDQFTTAMGMAAILVDYRGKPVTSASGFTDFITPAITAALSAFRFIPAATPS